MARSRAFFAMLALVLVAGAGFIALGVWQLDRLAWKEDLIARVERQVHAQPGPAPAPSAALERQQDEYRRLRLAGRYDFGREVLVRASTELGTGYWVLTPLRTDSGWVLVNRGFVPPELRGQVPHGSEQAEGVGLLRFTEPGGSLLQSNLPAQGRWYSRDVTAIAQATGLQGPVAPYFVDLQATPDTARAWPRPGLTVLNFYNHHLQYALTWFALAAMMAAAAAWLLRDAWQHRRLPGAPSLAVHHPSC